MWRELKNLEPTSVFRNSGSQIETSFELTHLDEAFNTSARQSYGQTIIVTGLWIRKKNGTEIYHPIDWMRIKQKRISHLSYGAEIISCTDADDHGLDLKMAMRILLREKKMRHIQNVDSKAL